MQTKLFSIALISASLLASSAFAAEGFRGQAKLAGPAAASSATVNGVEWRCNGDTCTGFSDRKAGLDSHMKECRKVAAALGPLSAYSSRGRAMTAGNVATCNRLAQEAKPENELAAR